MRSPPLPAAFALLTDERNRAADAALAEVLPHLEPTAQEAALSMLVTRGHTLALAAVVGGFSSYGDGLQRLICVQAVRLSAGIRAALSSSTERDRTSAIELIVRSRDGRLAYLLADALRTRCPRTVERAAEGLYRMTAALLDPVEPGSGAADADQRGVSADGLAEALGSAIHRWELHLHPRVLEAALWMGGRTESAILRKVRERGSRIVHALRDRLERTSDTRWAGFVLRALAVPELRPAAARAISRTRSRDFVRAVLRETWLLADEQIEHGCRRIQDGEWLSIAVDELLKLGQIAAPGAVGLLAAIGLSPERKIQLFATLAGAGRGDIRSAVGSRLLRDESDAATEVLTRMAARTADSVARIAAWEARRRRGGAEVVSPTGRPAWLRGPKRRLHEAFHHYWHDFGELSLEERTETGRLLRGHADELGVLLRSLLASAEPLDRVRALQVVSDLGVERQMDEWIHRLAGDPVATVRSRAVGMLSALPGPTTLRVLRSAISDPDERVQANAIEAFDRLNLEERVPCTEPKLQSSHSRVRANAIRSLLRAERREAGGALIDMLEDSSRTHRLSALWVVDGLRLRAVQQRVQTIRRRDPDERIRSVAERVLANLGPDDDIVWEASCDQTQSPATGTPGVEP